MPVLSMFYGIIVRMYMEKSGRHNMPHIHAEYSGEEVVVAFDGKVLEGAIPPTKMKLLAAWMEFTKMIWRQTGSFFPTGNSISGLSH